MLTPEEVKKLIRDAFADARYPGDDCLRGSDEGDEPFAVQRAFRGRRDWESLPPQFIDRAPAGLASALSFLSHEAFCFYLPAYLIADVDGQLECADPVFHLTHGLDQRSASQSINAKRFGSRTWSDYVRERFAGFSSEQAAAIVAYLTLKRDSDSTPDSTRREIDAALDRYWHGRVTTPHELI